MIYNERGERHGQALDIAKKMMTAARTAPKGKGVDAIELAVLDGIQLTDVAAEMRAIAEETGFKFFLRDAACVEASECMVLVGTVDRPRGLNCGHCGFARCADRSEGVPCEIGSVDVGIALGSAVSKAADYRVDTRILFSAGLAAQRLAYLGACRQVYGIPVSVSSKSPFFDR